MAISKLGCVICTRMKQACSQECVFEKMIMAGEVTDAELNMFCLLFSSDEIVSQINECGSAAHRASLLSHFRRTFDDYLDDSSVQLSRCAVCTQLNQRCGVTCAIALMVRNKEVTNGTLRVICEMFNARFVKRMVTNGLPGIRRKEFIDNMIRCYRGWLINEQRGPWVNYYSMIDHTQELDMQVKAKKTELGKLKLEVKNLKASLTKKRNRCQELMQEGARASYLLDEHNKKGLALEKIKKARHEAPNLFLDTD